MRANRVRWSAEERSVVVATMAKLLGKGRFLSRIQLVRDAQDALPTNRRRSIFTNKELKGMVTKAEQLSVSAIRPSMIADAEAAAEKHAVLPLPLERKEDLTTLLESLIDKIADKVAERLAAQLQVQVHTTTTTHSEHRPRHNPEPPCSAPREPKIGVLILGMQPHQGNLLKQEFPKLDITCYDSDEARTKQVLLRAHTIGMTRFLSHQVEERYRKCPRYHRHSAGTSELKTLLGQIQRGEV